MAWRATSGGEARQASAVINLALSCGHALSRRLDRAKMQSTIEMGACSLDNYVAGSESSCLPIVHAVAGFTHDLGSARSDHRGIRTFVLDLSLCQKLRLPS